jgi:transposase
MSPSASRLLVRRVTSLITVLVMMSFHRFHSVSAAISNDGIHPIQIISTVLTSTLMYSTLVNCIDFPPLSPDLNPIENLRANLKRRVERRHARTAEELERYLGEEWEATSPTLLASLAHSMPTRLAAVRSNSGHHTGY